MQRIEAFWFQLRKGHSDWWITLFKVLTGLITSLQCNTNPTWLPTAQDMRDNGMFTDDAFNM